MVLSLGDVLANEEIGAVGHLLFVHSIDGFLGGVSLLERDVSLVGEDFARLSSSLHMSRLNFTKLSKHSFQTVVVSAGWQALNKDVQEAALAALTLLTALMGQHFNFLAVELEDLGLGDGGRGGILALELNVSEATAFAVWEELKLARANGAKGRKRIVELLLGDSVVDVANEDVGLWLHKVALLEVAANEVATDFRVVHLVGAATRLIGGEELEEAVAVLTLSLLINVDDCLVDVKA